jgi:hypothetical protein
MGAIVICVVVGTWIGTQMVSPSLQGAVTSVPSPIPRATVSAYVVPSLVARVERSVEPSVASPSPTVPPQDPPASAEATATPNAPAWVQIPVGGEWSAGGQANTRWICSGDVIANGVRYFDDSALSGLIVGLWGLSGASIDAPFGASCLRVDDSNYQAALTAAVESMHNAGCAQGCQAVRVVELGRSGEVEADAVR